MIQKFLKQIIDFGGAAIGLIITSPLFLIISFLIKLDSKGPVFFKQERVGKDEKTFIIFKFRTMVKGAKSIGLGRGVSRIDSRITRVGRFLREWTLDELPQLVNVLKGEMSLVGPRPMPKYQVEAYNEFQRKRLLVKPGMVSLVDIKGRNLVPWEKRFEYDIWYIEHWSLWLDLKILFLTPFIVLSRKGVYGKNDVNSPFC